ncbi:MAG: cytochrome c biogenesis protein ResB [Deltaproteobacteria bacterium]|nr:cytochrome c biogenesis protein ResB [Deltaproteobacteria bacterium]
MRISRKTIWSALTSFQLAIACLALLMVLVVACTLAQVELGTYAAVHKFMNCFVVWWHVPGTALKLPVFPGGATVGTVLVLNLVAAQLKRIQLNWRQLGLWIVHAGLVLLMVGQFVSGAMQVEMRMAIEQGQTLSYLESPRDMELVITDGTDPKFDDEYAIPESMLERLGSVAIPGTPLTVNVRDYYRNAKLGMRQPNDPPSPATAGIGPQVAVQELPPVTADDAFDTRAVFVEPVAAGKSYGTWLVSPALGAPQMFFHEGRKYQLSMRPRRQSLPYALTLKKFSHDVYLGTDVPKNFSSLVHLSNPARGEERDVLIYMNSPLRYGGKAFYQASFGKNDTLSILQVVDNPGWLLPYISCAMVALGLVIHFAMSLRRGLRRQASLAGSAS